MTHSHQKARNLSAAQEKELTLLPRLTLSDRQLFDVEQILVGGFAPLIGFLNEADYHSVVEDMRLTDGSLWPIPIVLDVPRTHGYTIGDKIVLCDRFGNPIAFFTIESIYSPDKQYEAQKVYGTQNPEHVGVKYLFDKTYDVYLGGPVTLIARPPSHDFKELRFTPAELRARIKELGHERVVAFQTRNPIHRAHYELIRRNAEALDALALVHPVVGITKEGDIDYVSRVRAYKRLVEKRMKDFAILALLPIAMRMAGPREALWHALIRKNYGATHFIIGRDHAGVKDAKGVSFYGPYDSQELVLKFKDELGIGIIPMKELAYVPSKETYIPTDELVPGEETQTISGTEFRRMLREGTDIPEWFSFPEVVEELRVAMKKEEDKGAVVFFTGFSGAGKSTIAHILYQRLLETQNRTVTMLDGDVVRLNLSKGLGFSHDDRNLNIERIGYVASEIARHGGIAICAAIAPYRESRDANRHRIEKEGTYIEVYVKTPLDVCESRDTKGLYGKARAGLLSQFTGIDDPYEVPNNPEITIDTTSINAEDAAEVIYQYLEHKKLLKK